jgi:RimJ/RimL family protein N-acetyltransferase
MSAAPSVQVPRITTARLLLREARRDDFEAFAEDNGDPIARAHVGGVLDRRMAWRVFNSGMGSWIVDGAGWWMVELTAASQPVGMVGAFFREPKADGSKGDLELGWTMFRRHWGQGFATEAAQAALRFGLDELGVKRAIAHIDAGNIASIRVSQHLGMRHETDLDFYGEPTRRYAVET